MAQGVAREKREEGVVMGERAVEVEERDATGSMERGFVGGRCVQIITNSYKLLYVLSRRKIETEHAIGVRFILPQGPHPKALE
jgi:hypothetical protein